MKRNFEEGKQNLNLKNIKSDKIEAFIVKENSHDGDMNTYQFINSCVTDLPRERRKLLEASLAMLVSCSARHTDHASSRTR